MCATAALVVTLTACGQEGGSPTDVDATAAGTAVTLATAFGWTTSADAATPPEARGEVGFLGPPSVYDGDEVIEASGPSLTLTGLTAEPDNATAELVLSDAAARATYALSLSDGDACPRDGTISLVGQHPNRAADLPDLGEPPYAYEVSLTLDGKDHVGTGKWPDDLHPAMSNQLALTWTPPLPTWTGSP